MDRVQRLQLEADAKLNRLQLKHVQEWTEANKEAERALALVKTEEEFLRIEKKYGEKFELLRERQKEEYRKVQGEIVKMFISV